MNERFLVKEKKLLTSQHLQWIFNTVTVIQFRLFRLKTNSKDTEISRNFETKIKFWTIFLLLPDYLTKQNAFETVCVLNKVHLSFRTYHHACLKMLQNGRMEVGLD